MNSKLIIIGASGHGKVVADIALKMNKWQSIFFLDDDFERNFKYNGIEVIGSSAQFLKYLDNYDIFVGIGNNAVREKIYKKLEAEGASIPTLIHPSAIIGGQVEIGFGTVVAAGAIINPATKIGKGCIVNTGATVDHDNTIGDYVHISPGVNLAGTVWVGSRTWLGIGSVVINNINIVNDCTIGAGTVVIRDISDSGTYAGNPVKKLN